MIIYPDYNLIGNQFHLTTNDFDLMVKLFTDHDDKITAIPLGSFKSMEISDDALSLDYGYLYTRVLLPILDKEELVNIGLAVVTYCSSDLIKAEIENKKKWMFRLVCKAIKDGFVEKEKDKEILNLNLTRVDEIEFLKPTPEQVQEQIDKFKNSSFYKSMTNNETWPIS